MPICSICGFNAKNQGGLNLHMMKHKKDALKVEEKDADIVLAKVQLFNKEGKLILTYRVQGQNEINKAMLNAEKKGLKIEITDITKIHI